VVDGATEVITNDGRHQTRGPPRRGQGDRQADGASGMRIGTVLGDDLMTRLASSSARRGTGIANWTPDEPLNALPSPPLFGLRKLGAFPIADALAPDADVVIRPDASPTTRAVPRARRIFGTAGPGDWDHLAGRGSSSGHLLECWAR